MSNLLKHLSLYYKNQKSKGTSPLVSSLMLPTNMVKRAFRPRTIGVVSGYGYFDKPLLVTYARSGTNWVRYFLETMSSKPTPGANRLIEGDDYIIDRAHAGFLVLHKYNKAIIIVRNYKECIIRQHKIENIRKYNSVSDFLQDKKTKHSPYEYMENIVKFDEFKGEKIFIYYEDLITKPETELPKLASFFKFPSQKVDEFLENLESHKEASIAAYTKKQHTSETSGNTTHLTFHADKNLSDEEKITFDKYFEARSKEVFDKYLKRYAEN